MKSKRLQGQEALALELLGRGLSQRRIAAALGASQGWVSQVKSRHSSHRPRQASLERQARIVALREQGLTYAAIAQEVGCRQSWVYKVLRRRQAIQPRPSSSGPISTQTFPGAEYRLDEAAYLAACERYRASKGKRFLTACDYLEVAQSLLAETRK